MIISVSQENKALIIDEPGIEIFGDVVLMDSGQVFQPEWYANQASKDYYNRNHEKIQNRIDQVVLDEYQL